MPRTEYHTRDSRSRKDLTSSSSAVFFSLSRMTVSSSLISTVLVFLQPPLLCSKMEVLFLTSFRYSVRHSLKRSLRTVGDLPMQETEISSFWKKRFSLCTLRNVNKCFLYQKKKVPFQGEYWRGFFWLPSEWPLANPLFLAPTLAREEDALWAIG